ncbi:EAL domain-containing protein [Bacillus sp. OxB-1]|uniref:EAL domain-containing protein n=1 Tax=Bacillus sp. (strain OxB-1) TaxID=98228 RepID=UPI003FA4C1DF
MISCRLCWKSSKRRQWIPVFSNWKLRSRLRSVLRRKAGPCWKKIRTLGIQISLDDFGTGYSSFSHLKELPIDVLKIDRSFLGQLIGNEGQEAIVRSIIHLGHNLNFRVLVEGPKRRRR